MLIFRGQDERQLLASSLSVCCGPVGSVRSAAGQTWVIRPILGQFYGCIRETPPLPFLAGETLLLLSVGNIVRLNSTLRGDLLILKQHLREGLGV